MTHMFDFIRSRFWPVKTPAPHVKTPEELVQEKREAFRDNVRRAVEVYHTELGAGGLVFPRFPFEPYTPPKGVAPAGSVLALDVAWQNLASDANVSFSSVLTTMNGITSSVLDGMGFPGFPFLTELTQLTEYRDMSERTAAEMTRKWIELRSISQDDNKEDIIEMLEGELKRHGIRHLFRQAAVLDGFMGRCQLFINLGEVAGQELETPLMLNPFKVKKGSLRGFKLVEPITTYPAEYNSSNPLASNYYKPSAWFVYGQKVHDTRLLSFVSRPLPDLLKPVYNFSGMSLSQLAQPYVDYWFGTRDSVGKLLRNFSVTVLNTDLDILLAPSGDELLRRTKMFTRMRDNQGVFLLNKQTESLEQLNVPLSGLADLQAQAQEHMAAVAKTPLVILLGITPKGLNASAEGDIRIYYDYVADQQDKLFRQNLEVVLKVIMLDKLGYVDEDITFDFVNLYEMTGKELAMIRKSDSEVDATYIDKGVIAREEVRAKVATDPQSGYDNLDVDEVPPEPVVAAPEKGKKPGETDSVTAEENNPGAADVALDVMAHAKRLAQDGGFRGNQFLGGYPDSEYPSSVAMRLSGAATAASRSARKLGTGRAHAAARSAHSRALKAHQRALSLAPDSDKHVHEGYIQAHNVACLAHGGVV